MIWTMKKMMMLAAMAIFCVSMSAQQPVRKCDRCPAKSEQCEKKCDKKDCKKKCDGKCADCKKGNKECQRKCSKAKKGHCSRKWCPILFLSEESSEQYGSEDSFLLMCHEWMLPVYAEFFEYFFLRHGKDRKCYNSVFLMAVIWKKKVIFVTLKT